MAEDLKEKRRALQAQLEEVQRQEDAARAAAALVAQGQPLTDALLRATTVEDRVEELEASSQQLATQNRKLERTNIQQRQHIEELTARLSDSANCA